MNKLFLLAGVLVFFIVVFTFVYSDQFTATAVWSTEPAKSAVLPTDESIVYYLKVLNSNLAKQTVTTMPSAAEVKADITTKKGAVNAEKSSSTATASGGASVTWSNLLSTQDSTIVFPAATGGQLKLVFSNSKWNFMKYLDVFVSNKAVDCYYGIYGSVWNAVGGPNTLVYGWNESQEACEYAVSGKYVVDAKLGSAGSYYSFNITSPIIPAGCNGKNFDQSTATNGVLTVTC